MLAAIDRQCRAGDETSFVGDEEQDGPRDVLGLAEPADRDARHDLLQDVLRHGAHHLGIDIAGRDGVDRDAARGAFLRQRLCKAVNAGFGGGVIDLAVLPGLAVDRADIDDSTKAAVAHALDDRPRHVEA